MPQNSLNKELQDGLLFYSHLIGTEWQTTREFATMIRASHQDAQAFAVAHEFEQINGLIRNKDIKGEMPTLTVEFDPWGEANKFIIAARNAGWHVQDCNAPHAPEKHGFRATTKTARYSPSGYLIAGTHHPELHSSEDAAWRAACAHLDLSVDKNQPLLDVKTNSLYRLMRKEIESPASPLKSYRQDFYCHDLQYLRDTGSTGEYLWLVRQDGTHLVPVGMHQRLSRGFNYAMEIRESSRHQIYLINADKETIKPISDFDAKCQMEDSEFDLSGMHIRKNNRIIAHMEFGMSAWRDGEPPQGIVKFYPEKDARLTLRDLAALRQIAVEEVGINAGSLFTRTKEITIEIGNESNNILTLMEEAIDARSRAIVASRTEVTWYGAIGAAKSDRALLESLGIKLGSYRDAAGQFAAEVSPLALKELQSYGDSFMVDLHALPQCLNPSHDSMSVLDPHDLSDEELKAYRACLVYGIESSDVGDFALESELDRVLTDDVLTRHPDSRTIQTDAFEL